MIDSCKDCPEYSDCTKPCEKIESQLEKLSKWPPEIVESDLRVSKKGDDNNDDKRPSIDDARKIDPARSYGESSGFEVDYDISILPRSIDLSADEKKTLKGYIDRSIPREKKKQKRRFYAFLKCDTMTKIAKTAKTSKQNIQTQFHRIIGRVHKLMSRDKLPLEKTKSPKQFKIKLANKWV